MTILICGASGLVGRELCQLLLEKNIDYIGTYNSNKIEKENMIQIDFLSIDVIEKTMQKYNVTTCVFLIVQRLTDICEKDWTQIKKINVDMVNNTSYICKKLNVKFIHLSTDYVFDGTKQPNFPDDLKNPLQNYGISKLLSELKVQTNCVDYCIIRTPVLYSENSRIDDNAVTLIAKNIMDLRRNMTKEDHYCIRRPLYIKDLCIFILHTIDNDFKGIYHFYNPYNKYTKYEMCKKIANYLNINYDHIEPNTINAEGLASRPYDTMLNDNKYDISNFTFTDFDESLEKCFEKYKHPRITKNNANDFFILLDLDGTIINSNFAHYSSYKNVFEKKQIEFLTYDDWNDIILNKNFDDYLRGIFNFDEIKMVKEEKLLEFSNQEIYFTKNSDKFIMFLIENNINCCVVTNTTKKTTDIIKKKLPLLANITNWVVREDYITPKPSSECYELAFNKYYRNEKYIIGFEDTNVGYRALLNVTNRIYLYSETVHNLFSNNNSYIFNDYKQIASYASAPEYKSVTKYYSPIEFSKISDITLIPPNINFNIDQIHNKSKIIIYCLDEKHIFEYIYTNVLPHINVPFIIIAAMEDTMFPNELDDNLIHNIVNHPYFKHLFIINKTIPDDANFTSIPYGLNYWTLQKQISVSSPFWPYQNEIEPIQTSIQQDDQIISLVNSSEHIMNRFPKIYANFHLNITDKRHGNWRRRLQHIIPTNIIYYQTGPLQRFQYLSNIRQFAFVISPHGNGLDCIRTWEALTLGCIVIVKKSVIDNLYKDLPVLIVDNWEDVTEELLKQTLLSFSTRHFNYEKLRMNYWIDKIYSKFGECSVVPLVENEIAQPE